MKKALLFISFFLLAIISIKAQSFEEAILIKAAPDYKLKRWKQIQDGIIMISDTDNVENPVLTLSIQQFIGGKPKLKEMYEKYRSENVSKIEETKNSVNELDSVIEVLKKKIEKNVSEITNTNYSIQDKTTK